MAEKSVEEIVQNVVATQRLEGINLTADEIVKLRDYVSGKITKAEYMQWALRKAGVFCWLLIENLAYPWL